MNKIPNIGTWNEISALINTNFSLLDTKLLFAVALYKGKFSSADLLRETHPTAMVGSYAHVGTSAPYAVWVYGENGWEDSGEVGDLGAMDVANIPIATTENSGLMSAVHVNTLNELVEITDTLRSVDASPLFNGVLTITPETRPELKYGAPTEVVYSKEHDKFLGVYNNLYYEKWKGNAVYSDSYNYNGEDKMKKIYRFGNQLWAFIGGELKSLYMGSGSSIMNAYVEDEILYIGEVSEE